MMRKKVVSMAAAMLMAASAGVMAQNNTATNLHDFMEAYVEPAAELAKKGNKEPLLRILAVLPSLAADEKSQEKWGEIINKAVDAGKPEATCRSCHMGNKRSYARAHRDRLIPVPDDLLQYLQTALK